MRTATALAVCPDCQIWSSLTADWTGDGKVDLFFKPNGYAGKSATLYVNDGTGRFVPAPHTAGGTTPTFDANTMVSQSKQGYFIFGDFDNDQDLDIWLGEGTMQIYLNDGTGSFSSATTAMTQDFSDTGCRGGVAVDMDLDGDLDLMVATASGCASLSTAHVPRPFYSFALYVTLDSPHALRSPPPHLRTRLPRSHAAERRAAAVHQRPKLHPGGKR